MSFFVCACGRSVTCIVDLASSRLCPFCGGSLLSSDGIPLPFYSMRHDFFDLTLDCLSREQKLIYYFIKSNPSCCDADIKRGTGLEINIVTGRRWDLANCGIPLIKVVGSREVKYPKRTVQVKLWSVC